MSRADGNTAEASLEVGSGIVRPLQPRLHKLSNDPPPILTLQRHRSESVEDGRVQLDVAWIAQDDLAAEAFDDGDPLVQQDEAPDGPSAV